MMKNSVKYIYKRVKCTLGHCFAPNSILGHRVSITPHFITVFHSVHKSSPIANIPPFTRTCVAILVFRHTHSQFLPPFWMQVPSVRFINFLIIFHIVSSSHTLRGGDKVFFKGASTYYFKTLQFWQRPKFLTKNFKKYKY